MTQPFQIDIKILVHKINEIAQDVVDMIVHNTNVKGISYLTGAMFKPYSRNPFNQPYGSFERDTGGWTGKQAYLDTYTSSFKDKSGRTWIKHKDGYAMFKSQRWPSADNKVNLSWNGMDRGGMLSGIAVIEKATGTSLTAVVGFTDPEKERIARYHQYEGASRSRVKRPFFGLTKEQKQLVFEKLNHSFELSKVQK